MLNKLKSRIKTYFGFTRGETNGFVMMVFLFIALIFLPAALERLGTNNAAVSITETQYLDSLVSLMQKKISEPEIDKVDETGHRSQETQGLNPNIADFKQLKSLGLSDEVVNRIIKFREKGSGFKIKNDLKKIYGIDTWQFEQIKPFILLPEKMVTPKYKPKKNNHKQKYKSDIVTNFDINKADTTAFKQIQGVGSKLSGRIIKFRDKLGGFTDLNQLFEVYGLGDEVVWKIRTSGSIADSFVPARININNVSKSNLSKHPYISYKLADAIIGYRDQHGPFQSLDQLLNIHKLGEAQFRKIKPYLSI